MPNPDTFVGFHRIARMRASALLVAALCLTGASSAGAAKVYRCGNTFQDQPCAESKTVETRPAERTPVARQVMADCGINTKDIGARECVAMKIVRDPPRSGAATSGNR